MKIALLFLFSLLSFFVNAQTAFRVIPLGVKGGGAENNLSSYLVIAAGSNAFVCLDAGTLRAGLDRLKPHDRIRKSSIDFLRQHVKAFLLSHAHLDHVAGLILAAPDDSSKNIYCSAKTRDALRDKYFTKQTSANWGNEGEQPMLKKYNYRTISYAAEEAVENTTLFVRRFDLSHAGAGNSSAFLLRKDSTFLLYLGDTGADAVEKTHELENLWRFIAPLIAHKQLRGIFIECSFTNSQPDDKLYGHLTPAHLMKEMSVLAGHAGAENMRGLNVFVTHTKPVAAAGATIKGELDERNSLGLNFSYPAQGKSIIL